MSLIQKELISRLVDACQKLGSIDASEIELEVPANPEHGDFSTNIALKKAKVFGKKPRELGSWICENIATDSPVTKVDIAGPGFINFFIQKDYWASQLTLIDQKKDRFGFDQAENPEKILLEFVSANPTGPLHIGHGRNAIFGDTLARLLKAYGHKVTTEYYINDGGIQITNLGRSVWARIHEIKKSQRFLFPENGYQGAYIFDLAQEFLDKPFCEFNLEADQAETAAIIQKLGVWAGEQILGLIKDDLKKARVSFDHYFSESWLYRDQEVIQTIDQLKKDQLVYEKDGAWWLQSSNFGDDKDRVLIKSDGQYTYLTPDIAYHRQKFGRGFERLINIWGADHAGYVVRLKAALHGLGYPEEKINVVLIQMVSLIKAGQLLSMSTRKAQYETLADIVTSVGVDATRYFYLDRSYQAQLEFDLEKAQKQSAENPVYYIQYAHARIMRICEKAKIDPTSLKTNQLSFHRLVLKEEILIIKELLHFPHIVKQAAQTLSPHLIAHYALALAKQFQGYYDQARSQPEYRIIQDNKIDNEKLFLVINIAQVLRNCLSILGIEAPNRM